MRRAIGGGRVRFRVLVALARLGLPVWARFARRADERLRYAARAEASRANPRCCKRPATDVASTFHAIFATAVRRAMIAFLLRSSLRSSRRPCSLRSSSTSAISRSCCARPSGLPARLGSLRSSRRTARAPTPSSPAAAPVATPAARSDGSESRSALPTASPAARRASGGAARSRSPPSD